MSTLKVNTIRHTGASSDAVTLATDGTCTAKITNNLSNRRINVNGDMRIAQRGTSTTTHNTLCVDRFFCFAYNLDEQPTFAQTTLTSSDTGPWAKGFRNALQITNGNQTSGAGTQNEIVIYHKIEAQDIANSGWDYTNTSSYLTLSFWVKSSVAQTFYGYLATEDGTSHMYLFSTGALSANTWKKVTVKIPGNSNLQFDNNNASGLGISFGPFYGTSYTSSGATLGAWAAWDGGARNPDNTTTWFTTNDATFALTGVQLEVGDYPSSFEFRSYGDELARCKRYYQQYPEIASDGFAPYPSGTVAIMTATTAAWPMTFDTMRAAPTVSWTGNHRIIEVDTVRNVSGFTAYHGSASTGWMVITCSGGGMTAGHSGLVGRDNSTSTYMKFSAEL